MKWYNSNKSKCLDISKISYWEYTSKEDMEKNSVIFERKTGCRPFPSKAYLLVVVDGCERIFEGEEAEEILNILKQQKKLLLERKE